MIKLRWYQMKFLLMKKISTKFIVNEKYKFMDVKKIEEKLPNKRTYNVYEFERPFMDLDTNNFLRKLFQLIIFLF